MADSDVIRAFLVQLGFQVNQGQLARFTKAADGAVKPVAAIGTAAVAAAVAVEAMVLKVTEGLERLYFASQRSHATVQNIQAIRYGVQGIGLAAQAGQDALEGLARAMRSNPGITALLNQMGIATKGRDTSDIYHDLLGRLRQMPFYLAQQYGQLFGIDPETLRASLAGYDKMARDEEDHIARLKRAGVDVDSLAAQAHEFRNTWRLLLDDIDILSEKITAVLLPAAKQMLEWADGFVQWLQVIDKTISSNFAPDLVQLAEAVEELKVAWAALYEAVKPFVEVALSYLMPFWKELGKTVLPAVGDGLRTIAELMRALAGLLQGDLDSAWEHFTTAARTALQNAVRLAQPFVNLWNRIFGGGQEAPATSAPSAPPPSNDNSGSKPLGLRQNNPGNLRWWAGTERKGGFANFGTMQQGLSALAQQLILYGRRGINTLEGIVARYAPAFENNVKAYVASLEKSTGFSRSQVLDLGNPEVLAKVMGGIIGHEQGQQPFSPQELLAAAQSRLGVPGAALGGAAANVVNFSQKTDIIVQGSSNPVETGRAVAAEQGRVNGDLQRNMQGAVR